MKSLPVVTNVKVVDDTLMEVFFSDGEHGLVNVSSLLDLGVFKALRDPAVFAQVRVAFGTVEWPGEIDLDPEWLYEKISLAKVAEPKPPYNA